MNIQIIASSFIGLAKALAAMGYEDICEITWNHPPVRINGIWHAEIHHESRAA